MRIFASVVLSVALALTLAAGPVLAQSATVGVVKTVEGSAQIVRAKKAAPATVGYKLHEGDVLKTGPDGSLGVVFRDETLLSLGPDTEIAVDEFMFEPTENKLSIVTRMVQGTAAYVSGKIVKISPQSARFETPLATIGIRGTKFLAKVEPREKNSLY